MKTVYRKMNLAKCTSWIEEPEAGVQETSQEVVTGRARVEVEEVLIGVRMAAAGQKPDTQEGYDGEGSDKAEDKLYVL